MIDLMFDRKEALLRRRNRLFQELKALPESNLYINKSKDGTRWYVRKPDGKRIYLSKSECDYAKILARKRIVENDLIKTEAEIAAIDSYINKLNRPALNGRVDDMKLFRQLLADWPEPIDSATIWMESPFESNGCYPEQLRHESISGHRLRSKSEAMIDRELFERGIPFRYECALSLEDLTLFPDFTIYKERTGEIRLWEHFGLVDDSKYLSSHNAKMNMYFRNDYLPGVNLYCTYETSSRPLSYSVVKRTADAIERWINT